MKKTIAAVAMLLASAYARPQATAKNATAPSFSDGSVSVDTAGTGIKRWSIYRVSNSAIQGKELATDFETKGGLAPGTYWVLGKKQRDGLEKFSLDTLIHISIAVAKDCDSLKVDYLNAMQQPDPTNPQNPLTCLAYSVSKANGYATIDKVYMKNWDNTLAQYQMPIQGGCLSYVPYDSKLYVVFTDASGCSVVGTNNKENKPSSPPIMVVPGTEPGPITNHVTIGVADCSGYYIHFNDVQYKICNYATAQAAGIATLDSIIVSGKFLPDCGDNTPVCQMYHPYAGYFWLDSVRAIPARPANANCWDDHQLNTATLAWENKGSKPNVPSTTNCWDSFQFNGTSCSWENIGSQPAMPADTLYAYQFDSAKCIWESAGLKDSSKLSVDRVETKELIWPNPFNDRIEIRLAPGSYGTLTTIDGKTIMRFDSTENAIDTRLLAPGTYFLNITIDRRTTSLKAVKN